MINIIAGTFKGRKIQTPKGDKTRPTSGILRKAVFDICRREVDGAYFLDLFAGSGAMGLEAISRGATHATFVEKDLNAIRSIKENISSLQIETQTTVLMKDVPLSLKGLAAQGKQFNIIYIDPPYDIAGRILPGIVTFIDENNLLAKEGTLFIEEASPSAFEENPFNLKNLTLKNTRRFSHSLLHQYKTKE